MKSRRKRRRGRYAPLREQLDAVLSHSREGAQGTKVTYRNKLGPFCDYLTDEFHLQNLRHLKEKHVAAYVEHLAEDGRTAGTIRQALSAIQFLARKLRLFPPLPPSGDFLKDLGTQPGVTLDPSWSWAEVERFASFCRERGFDQFADAAILKHDAGLRLSTCLSLRAGVGENILRTGYFLSKHRNAPAERISVGARGKEALRRQLEQAAAKDALLFAPPGMGYDQAIQEFGRLLEKFRNLGNQNLTKPEKRGTFHFTQRS